MWASPQGSSQCRRGPPSAWVSQRARESRQDGSQSCSAPDLRRDTPSSWHSRSFRSKSPGPVHTQEEEVCDDINTQRWDHCKLSLSLNITAVQEKITLHFKWSTFRLHSPEGFSLPIYPAYFQAQSPAGLPFRFHFLFCVSDLIKLGDIFSAFQHRQNW